MYSNTSIFTLLNFQQKKDSSTHSPIKHNAVRSKQHSFIAQLSARVQEVLALLLCCPYVQVSITSSQSSWCEKLWTHTLNNKYKNRGNQRNKTWCRLKKKLRFVFLFCTQFNRHLHIHTPVNLYLKCGKS